MSQQEKKMLSVRDLQARFGIGYATAYGMMLRLPCINIAPPGSKRKLLRVSAYAVDKYEQQRKLQA